MSESKYHAVIAANRFGYGARPGELELAQANPKQWLINQLTPVSFDTTLPNSEEIAKVLVKIRRQKKMAKEAGSNDMAEPNMQMEAPVDLKYGQKTYRALAHDSLERIVLSDQSIAWRLLDFFSNHFSVSTSGAIMRPLAATLEREAIAPNLYGTFADMLMAVTQHPAMLVYLNNERSFGKNSKMGKRGRGLNENLAREILELHTLGVDGGYTQADVLELAKGITGWSAGRPSPKEQAGFIFRERGHEPGTRTLLNKKYKNDGVNQGKSMLNDLAAHPATIQHVCSKLAHHFISDNPPESLVAKLVKRWNETNGNIKQVVIALINADESWQPSLQKFKSPREFIVSSFRAIGAKSASQKALRASFNALGQLPFQAGSPAGYSDDEADWNGGSALVARIEWSATLASRNKKVNADSVMQHTIADTASELTYNGVMRAESRTQALTLLLMSPEFQRR